MFRKMLIAVVAGMSSLSPLALTGIAQAHPPSHRPHHDRFHVYVRECCHEPWRCVGAYDCREDAWRVAHRYQHRGFEAFVR